MDETTARALNDVNRAFYRDTAAEFSATREAPWPGWDTLLERIEALDAAALERVLDVGCGNGRFPAFLAARGRRFGYVGVDASRELLALAEARTSAPGGARFHRADFVADPPECALPPGAYSLVVLFGVLHHVPGRERRSALLRASAARLRPGGFLALTAWQLARFRRFRERRLPWDDYNRAAARPIDAAQLEPGDLLLPWGEAGGPVRYVHFADDDELDALLSPLGLEEVARFAADGRDAPLNRYRVLRAPAPAEAP